MKWFNKDKTTMVETNAVEFYRFVPEVSYPGRIVSLDTLELQVWGGQKSLYGESARELFKILSTAQQ